MLSECICAVRNCKYFIGIKQDNMEEETERYICKAFLNRIPDEIAYGNELHIVPIEGQKNDIVFEKEVSK